MVALTQVVLEEDDVASVLPIIGSGMKYQDASFLLRKKKCMIDQLDSSSHAIPDRIFVITHFNLLIYFKDSLSQGAGRDENVHPSAPTF